jgi:glucan 1,3-beta-glucosidase
MALVCSPLLILCSSKAISDGNGRCGGGKCPSSTTAPAVVYFPAGCVILFGGDAYSEPNACSTYVVSKPLNVYYYTQLIGDGRKPPTLQASSSFAGMAVIDADPYLASGDNWYTNQNKCVPPFPALVTLRR